MIKKLRKVSNSKLLFMKIFQSFEIFYIVVEALRSYIYYKYIQRKRGVPANEKQMAKRAYFNEKRLARARMMNFNKETAMQVSRKAFKQSPKYNNGTR